MPQQREASLLPNFIRVKATTKCYCSNFGTKSGDARRASSDWERACRRHCCESKWKGNGGHLLYHRPTAARGIRSRLGKTDHLAHPPLRARRGQRHRFLFSCVVFTLPEQPLFATMCRVDCDRINAGVVDLGESLRLIAAERPH